MKSKGFTLVETLVIILVIAVLVGLLLPAVIAARESARRTECADHLKQIGVALAGHAAVEGRYPAGIAPSGLTNTGAPFGPPSPLSVHARLLPYLEQAALFNSINLATPSAFSSSIPALATGPENETALMVSVGVFLCRSDPGSMSPGVNYRGTVGPDPFLHEQTPWPGGKGAFPGLRSTSASDFADGLSQTVGFSERLEGSGSVSWFDRRRDVFYTYMINSGSYPDAAGMYDACRLAPSRVPSFYGKGGGFWMIGRLDDTLYNHVAPPNWSSPDCSADGPHPDDGMISAGAISARSNHGAGVNSLIMDGSVRFIKDSINLAVWRSLATRKGGESIDASSY